MVQVKNVLKADDSAILKPYYRQIRINYFKNIVIPTFIDY
jgi:hypothetical protein